MTYAQTSLDTATNALALRLSDAGFVRFVQDELDLYIIEALRTFNAFAGIATDTLSTAIAASTAFVDIPNDLGTGRSYTVTDRDLIALCSYQLYEAKSTASWLGSEMFTYSDLLDALFARRNQFLLDTGCVVTRNARYPAAPALINRSDDGIVALDAAVIDIRRAAWVDAVSGLVAPLWPTSHWKLKGASPQWNLSPALPRSYAYHTRAPVALQLAPLNASGGWLDLCTVNSVADTNPAGGATALGIPDDFTPAIKWGMLATLFGKDGPARDYARALFCERMYQRYTAMARDPDIIVDGRINGVVLQFSSIAKLDASVQNWQNKPGTPRVAALAGLNLFALYPVPDATYGLELTIVSDMPVPDQGAVARLTSYLQIGREYLDVILGYAQHLAMLKVGGQEFAATSQFSEVFFAAAKEYSARPGAVKLDLDNAPDVPAPAQQQPRPVDRQTGATLR